MLTPQLEVDSLQFNPSPYATSPMKLEIELRNTGNQLAIVTYLQLRIAQFKAMPICFTQGDLPVTGDSTVNMPANAVPGQNISVAVHQQVAPDSADRFDINLKGPLRQDETIFLYRVNLSLLYDTSQTIPIKLGEAMLSLPNVPNNEYYWTKQDAANHGTRMSFMGTQVPRLRSCMIANSKFLQSFLANPGYKPGMNSISSDLGFTS
jgi:hypothetical protein